MSNRLKWGALPLDTQNTLICLSAIAVMKVIFWIEDNSALFLLREFIQLQTQKLIIEQIVRFYSPSNALCSSTESVQVKHFKHHMLTFHLIQSGNKEFLFMKTQRLLNRLSKCANVRYHKDQVFLWFTLTSQSKLKKFSTLFLRNLPRKTCYEI